MQTHVIENGVRGSLSGRALAFARDEQWVQDSLWVLSPDTNEQLINQVPHGEDLCVNSRHDLRNDGEPRVNVHVTETFYQRRFDFGRTTMVKPKSQEA